MIPDGVTGHYRGEHLVFEIDMHKAKWKGKKWFDLSTWDKRKFENSLFLSLPKENPVFLYK